MTCPFPLPVLLAALAAPSDPATAHPPARVSAHTPARVSAHTPARVMPHPPDRVMPHPPARVMPHPPDRVMPDPPAGDELTQAELEARSAAILEDIAELRGQDFQRPVRVAVTDPEGFLEHALDRMETFYPEERLRTDERIAKHLGLLPRETDLLATLLGVLKDQVGGFYEPKSNAFYVLEEFTGPMLESILAHELTHALDDQLYDLDALFGLRLEETDGSIAVGAVVEGSATLLETAWTERAASRGEVDAEALFGAMLGIDSEALFAQPEYLWKPLLFPYLRGASFLVQTESVILGQVGRVTPADLHRAFTEPPLSSEQVLHPAKYWDPDERDDPRAIRADASALPDGWRLVAEDTLGELVLSIVATPPERRWKLGASALAQIAVTYTNFAADGWGGDRVLLLERDGASVVHLLTVWDTPRDRAEFAEAALELLPSLVANLVEQPGPDALEAGASAAGAAGALERGDHGARVVDEEGRPLALTTWVGASGDEVTRVLAALRVAAEPRPAR